jgi:hypothetical protein
MSALVERLERAIVQSATSDDDAIEYAKKILAEAEIRKREHARKALRFAPPPSLPIPAPSLDRAHKGAYSEIIACAWLMKNDYDVFRAVSPHGPVDLVAVKDGVCHCFDVKSADNGFPGKTLEQQRLGVRILSVRPDGTCEIQPCAERLAA